MTLSELIRKNIKENMDYWHIEDCVWLIPKYDSENGEICFRYGQHHLRATDDFLVYRAKSEEDDECGVFQVDDETINEASNYLFSLKLDDQLKTLLNDKKRLQKI